jgi:hypothetical protein
MTKPPKKVKMPTKLRGEAHSYDSTRPSSQSSVPLQMSHIVTRSMRIREFLPMLVGRVGVWLCNLATPRPATNTEP